MPAIATSADRDDCTLSLDLRDQLVMDYAQFVTFIAGRIAARLPDSVAIDDLVSAGFLGLMDAIQKFDPDRDNKFKTYAEHRIRGAILDELRKWDSVSRTTRDKAKNLNAARRELTHKFGREPTTQDLADHLNLTLDQYHKFRGGADTPYTNLELDDHVAQIEGIIDNHSLPFEELTQHEIRQTLKAAISELQERERMILSLYYYEDLSLKEIGKVLSITESRVCQIHRRALKHLVIRLNKDSSLENIA